MGYRKSFLSLLLFLGFALLILSNSAYSVDVSVDINSKYQTIEGFGGGFMFGVFPYNSAQKDEIYDSLFNKARFNVIRIANFYDPQENNDVEEIPMMLDIQENWPHIKTFMASWSPPPYLKSNNSIEGITGGVKATLKQNNGSYMYNEYADYWYNSIQHFKNMGVKLDWVSIQNEPDWPAEWEGCLFTPTESGYAAYGTALNAVYNKIQSLNVPLIGPDMTGPNGYNNSLSSYMSNLNQSQLYAVCHHFYNGSDVNAMRNVKQNYPSKPRYQTEYLINEGDQTWFDHIQIMQNALVEEEVSMYMLFALAYKEASTHCCFSLHSNSQGEYSSTSGYTVRPIYFAFKHFSKSIHRGWKRIGTSGGSSSLKISAFIAPTEDSLAVVIINTGSSTTLNLNLPTMPNLPANSIEGNVFQTTKGSGSDQYKKYENIATFSEEIPDIYIDLNSITTIDIWKEEPVVSNITGKQHIIPKLDIIAANTLGTDKIAVSFRIPATAIYTLSIYDINGKKMSSYSSRGSATGVTNHLFKGRFASGSYIIKLECNSSVVIVKAIVIN